MSHDSASARPFSTRTRSIRTAREYKPGDPFAVGDDLNRLLSAGRSCLYGICHAASVGIGASPALGFVHTGGATSFVLEIADLDQAEYTIPLAFDLAARGLADERDIRTAFRDRVADGDLIGRIISDIKDLLLGDGQDITDEDQHHLWGENHGTVPGGSNWAIDMAGGGLPDSTPAASARSRRPRPRGGLPTATHMCRGRHGGGRPPGCVSRTRRCRRPQLTWGLPVQSDRRLCCQRR
jgi:hypothetical protein